jgi:hypothetical protein
MLCFRCEHRAKYLEAKANNDKWCPAPRWECSDVTKSTGGCYMFMPCKPIVTANYADDKRPRFGAAGYSARERAVRVLEDCVLDVIYHKGTEVALGWKIEAKQK